MKSMRNGKCIKIAIWWRKICRFIKEKIYEYEIWIEESFFVLCLLVTMFYRAAKTQDDPMQYLSDNWLHILLISLFFIPFLFGMVATQKAWFYMRNDKEPEDFKYISVFKNVSGGRRKFFGRVFKILLLGNFMFFMAKDDPWTFFLENWLLVVLCEFVGFFILSGMLLPRGEYNEKDEDTKLNE